MQPIINMSKLSQSPKVSSKKVFEKLEIRKYNEGKLNVNSNVAQSKGKVGIRNCVSQSPKAQIAKEFLDGIDCWCEEAQKKVSFVRKNIVSLTLKIGKIQPTPDEFKERRDDLIFQCQEFVNDRKFALKTQQELLGTKKLNKIVTRKMLGD